MPHRRTGSLWRSKPPSTRLGLDVIQSSCRSRSGSGSQAGYKSVGRASACRHLQTSDGLWFGSGWPDVFAGKSPDAVPPKPTFPPARGLADWLIAINKKGCQSGWLAKSRSWGTGSLCCGVPLTQLRSRLCQARSHPVKSLRQVRIELTTLGLWDLRAANCAIAA